MISFVDLSPPFTCSRRHDTKPPLFSTAVSYRQFQAFGLLPFRVNCINQHTVEITQSPIVASASLHRPQRNLHGFSVQRRTPFLHGCLIQSSSSLQLGYFVVHPRTVVGTLGTKRPKSPVGVFCDYSLMTSLLPSQNQLLQDVLACILTGSVALGSLKFFDELARRDVFEQKVNRKLAHITIGLLFMLFWPLFSYASTAPYLAALAPAINGLRVLAVGLGIVENKALVKSLSREGDFRELTKGPFYYAVTIAAATAYFWRVSPIGPVIVANLCAGDGFADLVGRRLGKLKLPYNCKKSYLGSLAMFSMGFIFSVGYLYYFAAFGYFEFNTKVIIGSMIVSLVSTIVESLPISTQLDDNFTIPFTALVVGAFTL